jgi:general secretion pathway protein H
MLISKAGVRSEQGFTLIELAMVLLVLGIAMAMVMPRFSGTLERQQMRRTVNAVRGYVRLLHARAAFEKREYHLVFDLEKQVMAACYKENRDSACYLVQSRELRQYEFPDAVYVLDVISPQGEKTTEGAAVTRFYPTGVAERSVIHLGTAHNQRTTLVIEPFGGGLKDFYGYVDPTKTS